MERFNKKRGDVDKSTRSVQPTRYYHLRVFAALIALFGALFAVAFGPDVATIGVRARALTARMIAWGDDALQVERVEKSADATLASVPEDAAPESALEASIPDASRDSYSEDSGYLSAYDERVFERLEMEEPSDSFDDFCELDPDFPDALDMELSEDQDELENLAPVSSIEFAASDAQESVPFASEAPGEQTRDSAVEEESVASVDASDLFPPLEEPMEEPIESATELEQSLPLDSLDPASEEPGEIAIEREPRVPLDTPDLFPASEESTELAVDAASESEPSAPTETLDFDEELERETPSETKRETSLDIANRYAAPEIASEETSASEAPLDELASDSETDARPDVDPIPSETSGGDRIASSSYVERAATVEPIVAPRTVATPAPSYFSRAAELLGGQRAYSSRYFARAVQLIDPRDAYSPNVFANAVEASK